MEIKQGKRLVAYTYFGGKAPHLVWLYSHFPKGTHHLVDAMCGSATVGINADCNLVTINDLNGDIVNFFQVLRDQYSAFMRLLKFTPYSRSEFVKAAEPCSNKVESARRFYVRAMQGFAGQGAQNFEHKGWGCEMRPINLYNGYIRNHFRVDTWQSKLKTLEVVAERLRGIQIEDLPVLELIKKYSKPGVLIYLDPPYVRSLRDDNRNYRHEFTDKDHRELLQAAMKAKCYVAISGYGGEMYDTLLRGWKKHTGPVQRSNSMQKDRTEILYTNY